MTVEMYRSQKRSQRGHISQSQEVRSWLVAFFLATEFEHDGFHSLQTLKKKIILVKNYRPLVNYCKMA